MSAPAATARRVPPGVPTRPRLLLPPAEPMPRPPTGQGPVPAVLRSVLAPVAEVDWGHHRPDRARSVEELPAPEPLCAGVALAAIEAIQGERPLARLTRWLAPEVRETLADAVAEAALARAATGVRPVPRVRTGVRRVRVTRPAPTVVEACVIVPDAGRVRAVALRLEVHHGSWRVVSLQIG